MIDKLGSSSDSNLENILQSIHQQALGIEFADDDPTSVSEGKIAISSNAISLKNADGDIVTITSRITGEIALWPGALASPPSGWLICDGSAVSRTTYADLFAVISTVYGVGDGSTTFNLPNFTNRFPYGANEGASAGNASIGSSGGRSTTGNDASVVLTSSDNTTGNLNDAGGGSPVGTHTHEITPPYLAIGFIIKT